MKLTSTISKTLDTARGLVVGRKARLVILTHAQSGGYAKGLEALRGWLVSNESEGEGESTGQLKLEVCESRTITAAMLASCAGFALLQAHESTVKARICKVVSRKEPLGEMDRTWEFQVTPTRETVSI